MFLCMYLYVCVRMDVCMEGNKNRRYQDHPETKKSRGESLVSILSV